MIGITRSDAGYGRPVFNCYSMDFSPWRRPPFASYRSRDTLVRRNCVSRYAHNAMSVARTATNTSSARLIAEIRNHDWHSDRRIDIVDPRCSGMGCNTLILDLAMDAPFGLVTYFSDALDRNIVEPLSCAERARKEQAYYTRFFEPGASVTNWKTATAFLAPPIAALTVVIGLLVYAMR